MNRPVCLCFPLSCLLVLGGHPPLARAQKDTEPKWSHGFTLQVRKAEADVDRQGGPRFNVDVYHDPAVGRLVYVAATGALAVAPRAARPAGKPLPSRHSHGFEMKVRPGGEFEFVTRRFGLDVYHDRAGAALVHVTDQGALAVVPAAEHRPPEKEQGLVWLAGLELKVRKGGVIRFDENTKAVGLELFRDPHTRLLVYGTEVGQLAVIAGQAPAPSPSTKAPEWYYGLTLKVRLADEAKFTRTTRALGVEVYRDPNTDLLLYVTETGAVAAAPARGLKRPARGAREPTLLHRRIFRVRPVGRDALDNESPRLGTEVYRDEHTNNLLYVSESGSVAVFGAD